MLNQVGPDICVQTDFGWLLVAGLDLAPVCQVPENGKMPGFYAGSQTDHMHEVLTSFQQLYTDGL